jgi:membrane protease YdiL (CAAX protease family)
MASGGYLRRLARRRPLTVFFGLAYVLGWIAAAPLLLSPAGLGVIAIRVPDEILMLVTTTPTLAALWVQRLVAGNFRIARIGGGWRRILLGSVAGIALILFVFALGPALILTAGGALANWPALLQAASGWWSNPLNLLGGPLNEEPGWRGFALPRLQALYGPLRGNLLLGLLWAGWHAPFLLITGWLAVPVWLFVLMIVCAALLIGFAVNLARLSLVPAILTHAFFNCAFVMFLGLCRGQAIWGPGLPIYVGSILLLTAIVVIATRGRLGRA